ncbi:MAG: hypothetical protein R3C18_08700 [Planctomycetaceae bacterium]
MKTKILAVAALVAAVAIPQIANAQASDSQLFRVIVPSNISITAPVATVSDTHDGADGDFGLPPQLWNVRGNVSGGVSVTWVVGSPFIHTTDSSQVIDARIAVAAPINTVGPATWTSSGATSASTSTSTATPRTASVTYVSDGPGRGDFGVSVSFQGGSYGSFLAGSYETTVTGTVTQN